MPVRREGASVVLRLQARRLGPARRAWHGSGTSAGSGRSPSRCSARWTPRWRWSPTRRWAAGAFGSPRAVVGAAADRHRRDDRGDRHPGRRPRNCPESAPARTSPMRSSGRSWTRPTPTGPASCGRRCRTCCRPSPRRPPDGFLDAVDTGLDSGGLSAVFDPETEGTPVRLPDPHRAAVVPGGTRLVAGAPGGRGPVAGPARPA